MENNKLPVTVVGKQQLEDELKKLVQKERPRIIRAIEEARSHGDLSENAEYEAAKEQQSLVEGRIQDIQSKLAAADVIDPSQIQSSTVVFGAHVKLEDCDTEDSVTYQIVGVDEANVKEGKISILSPLARALIGKKKGDIVLVHSPKGEKEYEIIDFYFTSK